MPQQLKKGQKVLVSTRDAFGRCKLREGIALDAKRSYVLIEFGFWIFKRSEWLDCRDKTKCEVTPL